MRQILQNMSQNGRNTPDHHVGLAYDIWAPVMDTGDEAGHISNDHKPQWLELLAGISINPDYKQAYARWENSFGLADRTGKLTLHSRLLVGHGNPAPTEVGLSVHHTWGVPIIPGSALKGLCAHYVETMFGPDAPTDKPWEDKERGDFQGVLWEDKRIKAGPGEIYRVLFGAPDAEQDGEYQRQGEKAYLSGASRGLVTFHDALYVPGSVQGHGEDRLEGDTPFAVDVLTVHQSEYYKKAHDPNNQPEPNDYDDPNPVGFLSVRPRAQFLLALSGPQEWVELAEFFLTQALSEWGIGGKTAAGYGHGEAGEWKKPERPPSPHLAAFVSWLQAPKDKNGNRISNDRKRVDYIHEEWFSDLMEMSFEERLKATEKIEGKYGNLSLSGARKRRQQKMLSCLKKESPDDDCNAL